MIITTAGTGTFTTPALVNSGATTITITNLTSGGGTGTGTINCTSAISTNRTSVITVSGAIPSISTQPTSQAVCIGSALNLSVTATGATSYQWKKNGVNISGATAASYSITTYAVTDAGSYSVDIINTCGTVTSNTVYVGTKASQPAVIANASATPICNGVMLTLHFPHL